MTALIHELLPKLERDNLSRDQCLDMLRGLNSANILPAAHPVCMRKFKWVDPLVIWFRSLLWGQTYIASVSNHGPWNGTHIRLFHIKQPKDTHHNNTATTSPRPSITSNPPLI